MKKLLIALPFVLAVTLVVIGAAAAVADTAAHMSRAVIRSVELSLDDRLSKIWPDTPMSVASPTRGLYLDGYGAVFTMEMITVSDGINMFHAFLTPQEKAQIKQKKVERMPQLQKAVAKALVDAAATLDPVPLDENVVIEVDLLRYTWEDGAGYPAELLFQSTRRKLLDVKHANGVGLDAAVRITEHN